MQPHRLKVRGFLAFPDEVEVDFDGMPAGIYAVWGENGAGKTTIVESLVAPTYRQFPSRDKGLPDYATRRDAGFELDFEMGEERLVSRVNVDPHTRTMDALLEQVIDGGRRPLNDGKTKTYDAVLAARMPPLSQLLASAFGIQSRKGSFTDLSQVGRKELFQRLIGAERYSRLAEGAKAHREAAAAALAVAVARVEALALSGGEDALAAAEAAVVAAEAECARATATLTEVESQVPACAAAAARAHEEVRELERKSATIAGDRDRHAKTEQDIARVEGDIARLQAQLDAWSTEKRRAEALRQRVQALSDAGNLEDAEFERQIQAIEAALAVEPDIVAARARVGEFRVETEAGESLVTVARSRARDADREVASARAAVESARAAQSARDLWREQVSIAETVPCHGEGAFASCRFLTEVAKARTRLETSIAPNVVEMEQALRGAEARAQSAAEYVETLEEVTAGRRTRWQEAESLAARAGEMASLRARRHDLERARTAAAEATASAIESEINAAAAVTARADEAAQRLGERRREVAELYRDREEFARHRDEWGTIETQLVEARERQRLADLAHEAAQVVLIAASRARATQESAVTHAQRHAVATRGYHQEYQDAQAQAVAARADVVEWEQHMRLFGRDGLPMIEIDQAGPAVTAHANALLAGVFGGRFTMQLVTQAPTADGKSLKDVFDIDVFDGERGGAKRSLSDLSGGQKVILDEALKSAIALFMNEQNLQPIRTCVRDETTGALDRKVVRTYVELLREVHRAGQFHHLLFVTHNLDAAVAADGIVWVHDGRVDLCYPPYDVAALESHQPAVESTHD